MIVDTRSMLTALQVIRTQNDECAARPIDGGWQLHCISPDGASMCNVHLLSPVFAEGTEGTPDEFVMELDRWMKALRTVGAAAAVAFEDGLIRLEGEGMRHTFRMLEPPEGKNRFKMPELEEKGLLTGECMTETDRIRRLLASVDDRHVDDITLTLTEEGLTLSAKDDALNGVDLTITKEESALLDGEGVSVFGLEMWQDVMKAVPADAVIDIKMGTDVPCLMAFGDRAYDVTWLCAPKITRE